MAESERQGRPFQKYPSDPISTTWVMPFHSRRTRAKATETRRKIIVSAIVTTEALKDPKIARWMAATLRKNATREVDQKELTGLLADLDAKAAEA